MRTIKFRGKRVDNNQWVYGHYSSWKHFNGTSFEVMHAIESDEMPKLIVHPETVGQFTGLLYKDGKEIYEGDLLRFINHYEKGIPYHVYHVVLWSYKFHMWYCFHSKNKKEEGIQGNCFLYSYAKASPAFELYSNIHDNPELL